MDEGQRGSRIANRRRRSARIRRMAVAILAVFVLAGCGSSGDQTVEDRHFATDLDEATTAAENQPTPVPTLPPLPPTATATYPSGASPAPVPQSTVATLYSLDGGKVIAADLATGKTKAIDESTQKRTILRVAPSLDGTQVAILSSTGSDSSITYDLTVRDASGKQTAIWKNVEKPLGRASKTGSGRAVLDWGNAVDRIAIGFPNGGAVVIQGTHQPVELLSRAQAPSPTALAWTPNGDVLAFVTSDASGAQSSLSVASAGAFPLDPVAISGVGGDRPIFSIIWQLDGTALFAVQGDANRENQVGGDVLRISRRTLDARFETGEDLFGPVAQIVAVAPSPDGETLAYVTASPTSNGGWSTAVWLVGEEYPVQKQVPLGDNPPIAAFAWTAHGISVTLQEPAGVRVVTADQNGKIIESMGVAAASPVASPVVSPPAGSPLFATPAPAPSPVSSPSAGATPAA